MSGSLRSAEKGLAVVRNEASCSALGRVRRVALPQTGPLAKE